MPKVLVNGKFSLLHVGHFNLLNYARTLAGREGKVLVAIDTDYRIWKREKRVPLFRQEDRKQMLASIEWSDRKMVDEVMFFEEDEDLIAIINHHKPDVMVKGIDWMGKKVIGQDLIPIQWCGLLLDETNEKMSSSTIMKKILAYHD